MLITEAAEKAMDKLMEELKDPESGFFDLDIKDKKCSHPEHDFPTHLHIPQGKGYKHVCPNCKKITIVKNP